MKMDDRDSAECQNWEKRDITVLMELLSHKKTKEQIGLVFFIKPKAKNVNLQEMQWPNME